jgi:hypothetical protein
VTRSAIRSLCSDGTEEELGWAVGAEGEEDVMRSVMSDDDDDGGSALCEAAEDKMGEVERADDEEGAA